MQDQLVVAGLATDSAISNVVDDTTPQLGGNLDMNGADIVTTSNATIDLAPNGTGTVVVRGNTNSGAIVFNCESNSHGQTVIAQPHSAGVTNTMLLPAGANSTLVSLVSTDTLTNKTLTSPKINEDVAVTSTATELNLLDGATVVIPGKVEGTNFTDSLLIGRSTTGTLNAAEQNLGVGIRPLEDLTSGDRNTAIGYSAGANITTGGYNTAVGNDALIVLTTASYNTAIGQDSLRQCNGNDNTAIGKESLKLLNTGVRNIGFGNNAGDNITSGDGNVIIGGVNADSATGDRQLKIAGYDGTTTTTWISGDSSGNVTIAGTTTTTGLTLGSTAVTSTAAELNFLDAVARGKIIYGNASGATALLTAGSNGQVLTSDGTDIAWADAAGAPAADDISAGDAAVSIATSSGAVVVDSNASTVTIDGHTGVTIAASSSGNITLDSEVDISLDANGGDIFVKDGGTTFGSLTNTSGNLIIKSGTTTAATFSGANVTFAGTLASAAITAAGHTIPSADDTYDLGSASKQWRNIYTGDLHLSNESKSEGNVVDGTTGNWTIQEGSENLFILNNKSGKKYKFKLEEI